MPGMDGLALLQHLHTIDPTLTIVLMTGHGTIEMAVQSLKDGAYDFVEKPFDNERILRTVSRAVERTRLLRENVQLQHQLSSHDQIHGFIGRSRKLVETLELLRRVAPSFGHRADPWRIRNRQGIGGQGTARLVSPGPVAP
jgi:DNA-binding NtrC family response regulator